MTICSALVLGGATSLLRSHAQSAPAPAPAAQDKSANQSAPAAGQQGNPPAGSAPVDPQKQQITSECSDLLKMAADLKQEVDKSKEYTLSVKVVRKAGEIEQLAHGIRTGDPRVEASHAK